MSNDSLNLYDQRKNRRLIDSDLPESLSIEDIIKFCAAHKVSFFALGTPDGVDGSGWDDPNIFRVGTFDFPPRGITVPWSKVTEWKDVQASVAACFI